MNVIDGVKFETPQPPPRLPPDLAASFGNVFTSRQLAYLEDTAKLATEPGGAVNVEFSENAVECTPLTIRRCTQSWINVHEPQFGWLRETIYGLVAHANQEHFRFQLSGIAEMIQLVRYHSNVKAGYGWHMDIRPDYQRKLSFSVQLTDPDNYAGGELQIMQCEGNYQAMPKEHGTVILFPSYLMHRVTPVEDGVRHALVGWIAGSPFV